MQSRIGQRRSFRRILHLRSDASDIPVLSSKLTPMNGNSKWLNRGQPITLQNACLLAYISAAFALLPPFSPLLIALRLAAAYGAFGIANERRFGYYLASGVAGIMLLLDVMIFFQLGTSGWFSSTLRLMIDGLFAYLLWCTASRKYQRIWFK